MKILVGLGNPGAKYDLTRHNVGFLLLDIICQRFAIPMNSEKFRAVWGKGFIKEQAVIAVKPMTFMNLSGQSVAQFCQFFKVGPDDLVVIHDDIDLSLGVVKSRHGGGHGGHNGIRSIIEEWGQNGFYRLKIGVGRPQESKETVSNWVLGPMPAEERARLETDILDATLLRLDNILKSAS